MSRPTVAILGATENRAKFGNKSVRAHLKAGYDVFPVNPRGGQVEGLTVYAKLADVPAEHLDRVSVYLPPAVTLAALDEIAAKGCDEVWFNPGSADAVVFGKARELGLNAIDDCSIVALGLSPSQFP